jgi:hypothetical protein
MNQDSSHSEDEESNHKTGPDDELFGSESRGRI